MVADLAQRAEACGWDGFFVWDHVAYSEPVRALADPWITLAAVAVATERLVIGTLVTPLARRRAHQLARETVSLDRLSGGRLVLGVGLGSGRTGEFDAGRFGEESDVRARARLLDERLDRAAGLLGRRVRAAAAPASAHPGLGGGGLAAPAAGPPRRALGRALSDRTAGPRGARRARRRGRGAARVRRRADAVRARGHKPRREPTPHRGSRRVPPGA